jgi:gliding motility-associated-like protein
MAAQESEVPEPPVLDLVSVDPFTGHTSLYWSPSSSPNVAGYIIYRFINNEGYSIDTVFSPYVNSYINTGSNAAFFSENYVINAFDSVYYSDPSSPNTSPFSNPLNTIYLEASIDSCMHRIELSWNPYLTDSPAVDEYRVYFSRDGSAYQPEGTTADTVFSIESFESYSEYCFYVEALLSNGTSSLSNLFCIDTDIPAPPGWINANYASYNEDGSVQLSFTVDPENEYSTYRIERGMDSLSGFENIQEIQNNSGFIEYTDRSPPEGILYYRLASLNNCGEAIVYSNIASTIRLDLELEGDLVKLHWNNYYSWRGGVFTYRVLRNKSGFFEEIVSLGGTDTLYTDNLRTFMHETGNIDICYRIVAEESFNPYYNDATSISDTKCIEQPVKIYVPNAFTPDDNLVNDIFKPVLSFSPVRYRMIINNRSGVTLFTTNDHLEGWNGMSGGRKLPEDVYIWFIEAETPEGKTISRTGTVTVIFNQ